LNEVEHEPPPQITWVFEFQETAISSQGTEMMQCTQLHWPFKKFGLQTVLVGQPPSQLGKGEKPQIGEKIGMHSQRSDPGMTQQNSPDGQTPSQLGNRPFSQSLIGSQLHPPAALGTQVVFAGHSPSQVGQGDASQWTGMHSHSPIALGTQTVPSEQSPSQLGYGDCSHSNGSGSQRHSSRLSM